MALSSFDGAAAQRYSSKSDIVCAILRELIISGELPPAEQLKQRDLATRFGVSQTPVREALRRLESEGLVINDPHRGATVAGTRSGIVEDNAQIRAVLEQLGARRAAQHIREPQIQRLRALNDQMSALPEGDRRYGELNRQFHFSIYECAESPILLSMMRLLWQAMPAGPKVTRSYRESTAQHEGIIAALERRDEDSAARLTFEHILGSAHLESEIDRDR
jgi:DNA-binding GntR family transcriptional regulator